MVGRDHFSSVRLRSQMLMYATVRNCARPTTNKSARISADSPFHLGAHVHEYRHHLSVQLVTHMHNTPTQMAYTLNSTARICPFPVMQTVHYSA